MLVQGIVNGMLEENCFLVMEEESKEIAIVDPGDQGEELAKFIDKLKGTPKYVLLTHGHFDHVGAVEYLCDRYSIPYYIHEAEEQYKIKDPSIFGQIRKADYYVNEGDKIPLGNKEFTVIHTPGHSKGGVCYLIEDHLLCGDTLFQGSIGRSDFIGGDYDELINSIKNKLVVLDDNIKIYSGHGETSTIGYEKRANVYLR